MTQPTSKPLPEKVEEAMRHARHCATRCIACEDDLRDAITEAIEEARRGRE